MHNVYIGIGTNIEPRMKRMREAISALGELGTLKNQSSIYETAPYGFTEQPNFLNAVVLLRTNFELSELHHALRQLEKELGRKNRARWHEREIDFDILFYDSVIFASDTLTIPHPELQKRAFVLAPLAEIAPDQLHPVLQKNIGALLRELTYDKNTIRLIES